MPVLKVDAVEKHQPELEKIITAILSGVAGGLSTENRKLGATNSFHLTAYVMGDYDRPGRPIMVHIFAEHHKELPSPQMTAVRIWNHVQINLKAFVRPNPDHWEDEVGIDYFTPQGCGYWAGPSTT